MIYIMTPKTRVITIDGIKTRYLDEGSGPAVTLIHGFPENLDTWRRNIPALSKHFRVIAFDMVGFGESAGANWDFSCSGLAVFVHKLLLALGVKKTHLVGTDTGASVAIAFAAQYKDAVDKFVFMASAPYERSIRSLEVNLMTSPVVGDLGFHLFGSLVLPYAIHKGFYQPSKLEPEVLQSYVRYFKTFSSKIAALRIMREVNNNIEVHLRKLKESCPATLILWADHERFFHSWVPERLHRDLKNSRLQYISDCGHFIQEEQPETFNRALTEFLTS